MRETEDAVKKRISQKLRALRSQKGFTQEGLSDLSGVDISYIGQIERGLRMPSIRVLIKLSGPLGVAISEFFKG